jgi:membrane protease YdiL (CAAX protease family)
MMLINHILFFIIIIVLPILIFFDIKKIKLINDAKIKETTYYKIFIIYWTITLSFLLFSPIPNIFSVKRTFNLNGIWTIAAILIGIYLICTQLLPVILLTFSSKLRKLTANSFDEKSHIYPTTSRQRKLFIIVPITVGICEEIIFRGYLYQYFQSTPYGLSSLLSLLLVSILFGLGHYQQGISGIVETLLLGYLLGFLYLVTGNLILPILLHILYDAKILYISWMLNKHDLSKSS